LTTEESVKLEKYRQHKDLKHKQRKELLNVKGQLAQGNLPGWVLIVTDFTQLNTTAGGFWQDMVLVFYVYDGEGNLIRKTRHYLAKDQQITTTTGKNKVERQKADVKFVIGVIEEELKKDWKNKHLIFFTDGCGRQFKCTRFILYLLKKSREGIKIDYHFFASNHGENICDVVGSQAQSRITYAQCDDKKCLDKVELLSEVVGSTTGHEAMPAPDSVTFGPPHVPSRKGLKEWQRIFFYDGTAVVWKSSAEYREGKPAEFFTTSEKGNSVVKRAKACFDQSPNHCPASPSPHP